MIVDMSCGGGVLLSLIKLLSTGINVLTFRVDLYIDFRLVDLVQRGYLNQSNY